MDDERPGRRPARHPADVARTALAVALTLASMAWAADFYRAVGLSLFNEQLLAVILGLGLALVFLGTDRRGKAREGAIPIPDLAAALAGFLAAFYIAFRFADLSDRLIENPLDGIVAVAILIPLVVEGIRRTIGWTLMIVLVVFIAYAKIGHLVPGDLQTRQVTTLRLLSYVGLDTNGLLGIPLMVGSTIVISFVFFGQLLFKSGGADFFNDLALALMGRFRGGAAKIAIVASSLFGSISGVVVSNIVATGVITIPLMIRAGYKKHQAAAIEAVASTGGQLTPPVMGAVAFLMTELLQIPYTEVVLAATIPAILYYVAVFIVADLEAAKMGITRVPADEIPPLGSVLKGGWFFIIPFAVIVVGLFNFNLLPATAALYGAIAVTVVGLAVGYKGKRMRLADIGAAIVSTGNSVTNILMIAAGAGIIIGVLNITGLGFALTLVLVELGAGNVIALLLLAALICMILGMGMPTVGVYILLAVLVAPSLVEVGVSPMAAHLFIFYFGMMSMLTPPVAIAAFFAASLAGARPMQTAFTAMRLGWTAYVVPFLLVASPSLLMRGDASTIAIACLTAVAGVWLISGAAVGYLFSRLNAVFRAGLLVAGVMLLVPPEAGAWAVWTQIAGAALGLTLAGANRMLAKKIRC